MKWRTKGHVRIVGVVRHPPTVREKQYKDPRVDDERPSFESGTLQIQCRCVRYTDKRRMGPIPSAEIEKRRKRREKKTAMKNKQSWQ